MPINERDRNRALKLQSALLLAASDMDQAAAAVRALAAEQDDYNLARALETAIAVCYARAFTQSSLLKLDRDTYEPADSVLAELHKALCNLRDKAYAHTDKTGGRSASVLVSTNPVELPGRVEFLRQETAMRANEAETLEWPDVDVRGNRFRLRAKETKSGRARWVQVPVWLMSVIADSCPTEDRVAGRRVFRGFSADGAYQAMARACKQAGLPHYHPHRRASIWHGSGVSTRELMERGGWARSSIPIDTYSHVMPLDEAPQERLEALAVMHR